MVDWIKIWKKVDGLLLQKGMSQYDLACAAGIAPKTLYRCHNEGRTPSVETLDSICEALDITLVDFFATTEAEKLEADISQLLEKFRQMTPKQRSDLLLIVNTYAGLVSAKLPL